MATDTTASGIAARGGPVRLARMGGFLWLISAACSIDDRSLAQAQPEGGAPEAAGARGGTIDAAAAAFAGAAMGTDASRDGQSSRGGSANGAESGSAGGMASGSDSGAAGRPEASPIDASDTVDRAVPPLLSCADAQLKGTGTPLATGSTKDRADNFHGTCAGGSAPDIAFDWIVPTADYYTVSTAGSAIDTVLYLREAACDGQELACNDDTRTSAQAEVVAQFTKDQRVVIVVDGKAGERGSVVVNAERVTCPDINLTNQPLPSTRSTAGGTNTHSGACGGENQVERAFRWTPPTPGLYSISARSSDFQPILYVEAGARCGGPLLGCNKASGVGLTGYPAEVIRELSANEPVTLIVDGGSGFFELDARRIDGDAGISCSGLPTKFGTSLPAPGRSTAANHSTASCASGGGIDAVGSGPFAWPDELYEFPIKLTEPSARCTYTFTSSGAMNVYLIGKNCSGPERQCVVSKASGTAYKAELTMTQADNGTYTLVLENASGLAITYDASVGCVQ